MSGLGLEEGIELDYVPGFLSHKHKLYQLSVTIEELELGEGRALGQGHG